MKMLKHIAPLALAVAVCLGLPSVARATTLNFGDGFDLGSITNVPEPSSSTDETHYVNKLIATAPGGTSFDIFAGKTHTYTRTFASCGTCPAAVFNSTGTGNTIDLGTGGFTYLLGKYDGPNGGDEVWNVQGLTGIQTIPTNGFGLNNSQYGLSHWTLFGGGGQVPDGGSTVALLGLALTGLEGVRRMFRARKA